MTRLLLAAIFIVCTITSMSQNILVTVSGQVKSKTLKYRLAFSYAGYRPKNTEVLVGKLSSFIDLAVIELDENPEVLNEVVVTSKQAVLAETMDKKNI